MLSGARLIIVYAASFFGTAFLFTLVSVAGIRSFEYLADVGLSIQARLVAYIVAALLGGICGLLCPQVGIDVFFRSLRMFLPVVPTLERGQGMHENGDRHETGTERKRGRSQ